MTHHWNQSQKLESINIYNEMGNRWNRIWEVENTRVPPRLERMTLQLKCKESLIMRTYKTPLKQIKPGSVCWAATPSANIILSPASRDDPLNWSPWTWDLLQAKAPSHSPTLPYSAGTSSTHPCSRVAVCIWHGSSIGSNRTALVPWISCSLLNL